MADATAGRIEAPGQLIKRLVATVRHGIPRGRPLPEESFNRRHTFILTLLWLQVAGFAGFALLRRGDALGTELLEVGLIALLAAGASIPRTPRWLRAGLATLGLITASAVLVLWSGGYIEMHFHFFVMVAVVSLYQSWWPFLLALGYVVLEHGTLGVIYPSAVYNHHAAIHHPWLWALIHGVFVLALSFVCVATWGMNESARAYTQSLLNSIGEGIFGLDSKGTFAFVNPEACRLLGWPASELTGRRFHDVVCPEDAPTGDDGACATCRPVLDGGLHVVDGARFRRRGGPPIGVDYASTPLREGDVVLGTVVTFRPAAAADAGAVSAALTPARTRGVSPDRVDGSLTLPLKSERGMLGVVELYHSGLTATDARLQTAVGAFTSEVARLAEGDPLTERARVDGEAAA